MITPEVLEALANEEKVQMATLTGWETIGLEDNTFGRSTPERPWVHLSAKVMMGMFKDRIWRIKPETMNFLEAVGRMKQGAKMRREGWGAPGCAQPEFIYYNSRNDTFDGKLPMPNYSLTAGDYEAEDWYEVIGE